MPGPSVTDETKMAVSDGLGGSGTSKSKSASIGVVRVLWPPDRINSWPPLRTSVAYPPSPWMYRSVPRMCTGTAPVPGIGRNSSRMVAKARGG